MMTTRDDIPIRPKAEDSQAHNKRADLIGRSYRERHQGQRPMSAIKGRTYGRTAPYGQIVKEPLTAGSFHIWESQSIQKDWKTL